MPPAHGPAEEDRPGVPIGTLRVSQGGPLGANLFFFRARCFYFTREFIALFQSMFVF